MNYHQYVSASNQEENRLVTPPKKTKELLLDSPELPSVSPLLKKYLESKNKELDN